MKQRYLFLLRFLGLSLVLFIFRHQTLGFYTSALSLCLSTLNPDYNIPSDLGDFIYSTSITMISFVALVIATPITIRKRSGFLILGFVLFLSVDWMGIQYMMYPQGRPPLDEDSFSRELYLSSKWILPLVLWIIMSYEFIGGLFEKVDKTTEVSPGDKTE